MSAPRTQDHRRLAVVRREPANIRIGCHGNVKLMDFGIAISEVVARSAHTQANIVMGSLPPTLDRVSLRSLPATRPCSCSIGSTVVFFLETAGRPLRTPLAPAG